MPSAIESLVNPLIGAGILAFCIMAVSLAGWLLLAGRR